jgi:hypothetical protein
VDGYDIKLLPLYAVWGTVSTHTNGHPTWLCAVKAAIKIVFGHNHHQDVVILLKHCVVMNAVVLLWSCIDASRSLVPGGGQVHTLLYPLST